MIRDKVKLRKLIDFISDIGSLQGNDWFIRELLCKISEKEAHKITGKTVNEVHEYCIKDVIRKQAEGFYSEFKISSLKPVLIADYIEMERFRRDDDFDGFCFKVNQQLEAIINEIATKEFIIEITSLLNEEVLYFRENKVVLGKLIYNGPASCIRWTFLQKTKAVLYMYYFNKSNARKPVYQYKFYEAYNLARDIYYIRNLNHRSNNAELIANGDEDAIKLEDNIRRISNNKHRSYMLFMGYLEVFTKTISDNI